MLGFIFGFNARLGRLAYFLSCIAFGVGVTVLAILLVVGLSRDGAAGAAHHPDMAVAIAIIVLVIPAIWLGTCLVSMRVRDIGWNPAIILPAVWAIIAADAYVAVIVPDWALPGERFGTVFGAAINFVFNLTVTFWPGAGYDASAVTVPDAFKPRSEPAMHPSAAAAKPAQQPAPATRQAPAGRKTFGRLGLQH